MTSLFTDLLEVRKVMEDFVRPWCFCGGWALDLYLRRETRPHDDIEIGLFRGDQELLYEYFEGWALNKVIPGEKNIVEDWGHGERLELPIHESHASFGTRAI